MSFHQTASRAAGKMNPLEIKYL